MSLTDPATPGEHLFNYLLNHERRYGFQVLRMISSSPDTEDTTTEFVCQAVASEIHLPVKQSCNDSLILWSMISSGHVMYRDGSDTKQADEYDVTLLVTHEPPTVVDDNYTLVPKYYVILSSKREVYPRLLAEKKSGKFRTVSTVTPPVR